MIKLQDFARQQGVTDRAIQKHLKTYAEELKGLYQRRGPNGTWLTEEACEILRGKMKQAPVTVIEASDREEELRDQIRKLERELFETQRRYTEYVEHSTPLLQKASEQLALAERAQEHKEKAEALEAQNGVLSADNKELGQKVAQAKKTAQELSDELTETLRYAADLEAWLKLPWIKRIRTPKPTRNKE